MMTDAKKILTLLQSDDEKNRLLAFQLMESLDAFQDVAQACEHQSLFHFMEADNARKGVNTFFYTKGPCHQISEIFIQETLLYFWRLKKQPLRSRRLRNAYHTLRILLDFVKPSPGYEHQNEVLIEYKNDSFRIALNWVVRREEKEDLSNALDSFESGREQELEPLKYYAFRPNRKYPFRHWMRFGRDIEFYKYNYHYIFKPIDNEPVFRFTFYIDLDGNVKNDILELLKSNQFKNRSQAFDSLIRSIRQEIQESLCEYTQFDYIDQAPNDSFIFRCTSPLYNKNKLKTVLNDMERIMKPLTPISILRKLFNRFVLVLEDLAQPQEGLECEIQLIYNVALIETQFSWKVDDEKKVFLEKGFAKAHEINAKRGQIQPLTRRRVGDLPDPDLHWKQLANHLKTGLYEYQFTPLNTRTYMFSLKLQIALPK